MSNIDQSTTSSIKRGPFIALIIFMLLGVALIIWGFIAFITATEEVEVPPTQPCVCEEVQPETPPELPKTGYDGPLSYVNEYRESKGLKPLELDTQLETAAQAKSDDLVSHNYWAHDREGATPWDFIRSAGYEYLRGGENLAKCFHDSKALVDAWINSPSHEANLVGNYNDIGFGVTTSPRDGCEYVTAHFGSRV